MPTIEKLPVFIQSLFCPDCLKIPEYSIYITKDEKVLLKHLCYRKSKEKLLSENDEFQSFITNNSCSYWSIKCENIFLKYDKNVCNRCLENHLINPSFIQMMKRLNNLLTNQLFIFRLLNFIAKNIYQKIVISAEFAKSIYVMNLN